MLMEKKQRGVHIRIILDHQQWYSPSSGSQTERVRELMAAGVEFKVFNVRRTSRYASMHAKTWCVDGLTYLGGSANFTNNADKSEETLLIIKGPELPGGLHELVRAPVERR